MRKQPADPKRISTLRTMQKFSRCLKSDSTCRRRSGSCLRPYTCPHHTISSKGPLCSRGNCQFHAQSDKTSTKSGCLPYYKKLEIRKGVALGNPTHLALIVELIKSLVDHLAIFWTEQVGSVRHFVSPSALDEWYSELFGSWDLHGGVFSAYRCGNCRPPPQAAQRFWWTLGC